MAESIVDALTVDEIEKDHTRRDVRSLFRVQLDRATVECRSAASWPVK
jgi:hypothetical protein